MSLSFFKDFFFFFFFFFTLLIYFYQTFCCCCLVLSLLYFFFFFLSKIFSFFTGLSSLLGPLGFWHLVLPVGVCSLECNNDNNVDRAQRITAFQKIHSKSLHVQFRFFQVARYLPRLARNGNSLRVKYRFIKFLIIDYGSLPYLLSLFS